MLGKPENFNEKYRPGDHLQKFVANRARRAHPTDEQLENQRKQNEWESAHHKTNKEIPGDVFSTFCSLDYPVTIVESCFKNGCTGFYKHEDGTYRSGYWQRADGTVVTDPKQVDGLPFVKAMSHRGDSTILAKNPNACMRAMKKHWDEINTAQGGASVAYNPYGVKKEKEKKRNSIKIVLEHKMFSIDQIREAASVSRTYVIGISRQEFSDGEHQENLNRAPSTNPEELDVLKAIKF